MALSVMLTKLPLIKCCAITRSRGIGGTGPPEAFMTVPSWFWKKYEHLRRPSSVAGRSL